MIKDVRLIRIVNSKGGDAVLVKLATGKGSFRASAPSGTSAGKNEARDLPFRSVAKAFPELRKRLIGRQEDFREIDAFLKESDGTGNFSRIGGNLATALSVATARAQTEGCLWRLEGLKGEHVFPVPLSNIVGGGAHGGGSEWQEFLVIPSRLRNPYEAKMAVFEAWSAVGEALKDRKVLTGRNIENAWTSSLSFERTLEFLSATLEGFHVRLGVDVAASTLWDGKSYRYRDGKLSPAQQLDLVLEAAEKHKLYYIEDPFHEEAFSSFAVLRKKARALVAGDDLFCTNPARFGQGLGFGCASGVIVKPNQAGTLTDALEVARLARQNGVVPVASHRSGETEDTWLADLGIAFGCPLIKIGCLGADLPKHNRLIELWDEVPGNRMADLP
jgi:enolase